MGRMRDKNGSQVQFDVFFNTYIDNHFAQLALSTNPPLKESKDDFYLRRNRKWNPVSLLPFESRSYRRSSQ